MRRVDTDTGSLLSDKEIAQIELETKIAKRPYTPKTKRGAANWASLQAHMPEDHDPEPVAKQEPMPEPVLRPVMTPEKNTDEPFEEPAVAFLEEAKRRAKLRGQEYNGAEELLEADRIKREKLSNEIAESGTPNQPPIKPADKSDHLDQAA